MHLWLALQNYFLKNICEELKNIQYVKDHPAWLEILESTGPFKLTVIYNKYNNKKEIKLLSAVE